jgi:hypothetical protein
MSYGSKVVVISGDGIGDSRPLRLLEQVHRRCRVKHSGLRTERVHTQWIQRFILANGKRHPREMGEVEVMACMRKLLGIVNARRQDELRVEAAIAA